MFHVEHFTMTILEYELITYASVLSDVPTDFSKVGDTLPKLYFSVE